MKLKIFFAKRESLKPVCGLFRYDPPEQLGAYGCAVTAGDLIIYTGGWYPTYLYPALDTCHEDVKDEELTAVNQEFSNYQARTQIFHPAEARWSPGPSLQTARRNHGCALVEVGGRAGVMVAGGYNSRDKYLSSVEFLDLGPAGAAPDLTNLRWRRLPEMPRPRADKPVVVDGGERVYVVGGGRGSSNPDNSVISFHKSRSRWQTTNYNAITKRSYTTFVRNVPTELNCVSKFE